MLHVPAPLCHLLTDLAAKMYGFMPRTVRQRRGGRRRLSTELTDELKRKMFILCLCIFLLDKSVLRDNKRFSSLPPKVAPCYALFEMPIRFAIEFAVNRQPQIESGVM